MKKAFAFILVLFSISCRSQADLRLVFDYDSTKVSLSYDDLMPFLKKENGDLVSRYKTLLKTDTLVLRRYTFDGLYYHDTLGFDLNDALFKAIGKKKGAITFNGKPITSYYTKKVRLWKKGKQYFRGIYYYERGTDRHFLTDVYFDRFDLHLKNQGHIVP